MKPQRDEKLYFIILVVGLSDTGLSSACMNLSFFHLTSFSKYVNICILMDSNVVCAVLSYNIHNPLSNPRLSW